MAFLASLLFFSITVLAEVDLGYYEGADTRTGEYCGFTIKSIYSESSYNHPLTIRFILDISGKKTVFFKQPIITEQRLSISPEEGVLTSLETNSNGVKLFRLYLDRRVPIKLVYISDNYYDPSMSKMRICSNLTLRQQP